MQISRRRKNVAAPVLGVVFLIAHLAAAAAAASNDNNNNNNKKPTISKQTSLPSPPSSSSVDTENPRRDRSAPNAPPTPWIASGGTLDFPRGVSSVFQLNGTFFVVGGCIDVECVNRSGIISRYDPIEESIVPSSVTQIPMNFLIPSKTPVLPPVQVPATIAGPTAVVPVASNGLREGALNVETRPWLVGPCALYLAWQGNSIEDPFVAELYHGIWGFSLDFSAKEISVRLPNHVPVRANASCQAYGTRIFIAGGVFVDTLEIADTIDAFDTLTQQYYPNVQKHVEPIMNPAITIDNHMMYLVGGQTTSGCTSTSHTYMWTSVGADVVPSLNSRRQLSFCQSTRVTAYYFSPMYIVNESIPLEMFILPDVPTKVIRRFVLTNSSGSGSGDSAFDEVGEGTGGEDTEVVELLKAFSFGGTLSVSSFSTMFGSLTVEHLDVTRSSAFGPLLAPTWLVQSVTGLGVRHASVMMYLVPYVIFGSGLAIFSIGGAYNGTMTGHIYERFVGLSMPAIRGAPPLVEIMGQVLNISLQPQMEGFLRLSDNAACVGNTVGTSDEPVSAEQQQQPVTFIPLFPADEVYVCFSFGPVDVDQNLTDLLFFSAINSLQPFAVLQRGMVLPTPAPKDSLGRSTTIILSVTIPSGCLMLILLVVIIVRRKFYPAGYSELDGSRRQLLDESHDDPKDLIIKQTTSDSRYTVVKRIGEGAFSSVYLVSPKADPSLTYALKFMVCADDRERLEAIKECETINSVQAHPNIIQLMDMFMMRATTIQRI
ncbi:protein kinase, putative [Bodo saltans]|uniref:Protein kinase, putative n=1 Tax=Bodo saltans TaxID=75058 RepID=A0A0S4J5K1_BODSA|nr:protein kinase, putative [Bodo saltans]|eukprot:CUG86754.1 protein kinase, putative [Bodo saltans]